MWRIISKKHSKESSVFIFLKEDPSVFWVAFELYLLFPYVENELQQFANISHPANVIALVIDQELLCCKFTNIESLKSSDALTLHEVLSPPTPHRKRVSRKQLCKASCC